MLKNYLCYGFTFGSVLVELLIQLEHFGGKQYCSSKFCLNLLQEFLFKQLCFGCEFVSCGK